MAHGQKFHAKIENINFTLFYDYDQLRDGKLAYLTDVGKVQWLKERMDMVFMEPIRRMMCQSSDAYLSLHSSDKEPNPPRTVDIAAFSVLLNGVESCGSFLTSGSSSNQNNFITFIQKYMKPWCKNINITKIRKNYNSPDLEKILWKYFRNGIAHQFCIEGGGIEYGHKKRWTIRNGMLQINSWLFFLDFEKALKKFFRDVRKPGSQEHVGFINQFRRSYPTTV